MIYKPHEIVFEVKEQIEPLIKALESGHFIQGRGVLFNKSRQTYCCLGVNQEINGKPVLNNMGCEVSFTRGTSDYFLIKKNNNIELTLDEITICIDECGITYNLAELNDDQLFSFDEIAQILKGEEVEK